MELPSINLFSFSFNLKKEKPKNGYFLEFNKKGSEDSRHHIFKENKVIDSRIDLKNINNLSCSKLNVIYKYIWINGYSMYYKN